MKICETCGKSKPVGEFYLSRSSNFKLHELDCKICSWDKRRIKQKEIEERYNIKQEKKKKEMFYKNLTKNQAKKGELNCVRCLENKPMEEFYINKAAASGRDSFCIECRKEVNAICYQAKIPEKKKKKGKLLVKTQRMEQKNLDN